MGLDIRIFKTNSHYQTFSYDKLESAYAKSINEKNVLNINLFIVANKMNIENTNMFWLEQFRKSNYLLGFFGVDIEDDCGKYIEITEDEIKKLIEYCDYELQNKDNDDVEHILKTQGGFFFGNTEYDEFYYNDVECTKESCEKLLKAKISGSKKGKYWLEFDW